MPRQKPTLLPLGKGQSQGHTAIPPPKAGGGNVRVSEGVDIPGTPSPRAFAKAAMPLGNSTKDPKIVYPVAKEWSKGRDRTMCLSSPHGPMTPSQKNPLSHDGEAGTGSGSQQAVKHPNPPNWTKPNNWQMTSWPSQKRSNNCHRFWAKITQKLPVAKPNLMQCSSSKKKMNLSCRMSNSYEKTCGKCATA
jgi:hypothetical protein